MATKLYRRKYRLNVAGVEITEHDVEFNVQKSTNSDPNRMEATVFNLAPNTIGRLAELPDSARVSLEAGYEDEMSLIYRGNLRSVLTRKENNTDISTTVEAEDGRNAVRKTFNKSYGKGTKVQQVIEDLAESLDLDIGNLRQKISGASLENNSAIYKFGTVVSGRAYDNLVELLKANGFEVSIQDGVLQVLTLKNPLSSTAVLLTPDTGLLQGASVDNEQKLTASCLMIPDVFPGRKVKVQTDELKGVWKLTKCDYQGSTPANDWTISIEGTVV